MLHRVLNGFHLLSVPSMSATPIWSRCAYGNRPVGAAPSMSAVVYRSRAALVGGVYGRLFDDCTIQIDQRQLQRINPVAENLQLLLRGSSGTHTAIWLVAAAAAHRQRIVRFERVGVPAGDEV